MALRRQSWHFRLLFMDRIWCLFTNKPNTSRALQMFTVANRSAKSLWLFLSKLSQLFQCHCTSPSPLWAQRTIAVGDIILQDVKDMFGKLLHVSEALARRMPNDVKFRKAIVRSTNHILHSISLRKASVKDRTETCIAWTSVSGVTRIYDKVGLKQLT